MSHMKDKYVPHPPNSELATDARFATLLAMPSLSPTSEYEEINYPRNFIFISIKIKFSQSKSNIQCKILKI